MHISCGGITLADLKKMPADELSLYAQAVEILEIENNLNFVSMINAGFSGNRKLIDSLNFRLEQLTYATYDSKNGIDTLKAIASRGAKGVKK